MRRQNDVFRRLGRGPFGDLLNAAVREPALLVYLDAPTNRRGHPNENLARELMELFTLGVGHFSEDDVKDAARALTGWTVDEGRFVEAADRHDAGEKTILTRRGRWTGSDLLRILLEQPATSARLAAKLCGLFFGETAVPADAVASLAAGLRERRLDIGWAVETILRSQRLFAAENVGNRFLGPVEFIAGAVRALELFDPAPSTLALADWSARLGTKPVRSAQRRRLAGRARLDQPPIHDSADQFRRRAGRRHRCRSSACIRSGRDSPPPWRRR